MNIEPEFDVLEETWERVCHESLVDYVNGGPSTEWKVKLVEQAILGCYKGFIPYYSLKAK